MKDLARSPRYGAREIPPPAGVNAGIRDYAVYECGTCDCGHRSRVVAVLNLFKAGWGVAAQEKYQGPSAAASLISGGPQAQSHPTSLPPRRNYRLYRKIARATKATVMIHRMTSLLPFFSSAIRRSTAYPKSRYK